MHSIIAYSLHIFPCWHRCGKPVIWLADSKVQSRGFTCWLVSATLPPVGYRLPAAGFRQNCRQVIHTEKSLFCYSNPLLKHQLYIIPVDNPHNPQDITILILYLNIIYRSSRFWRTCLVSCQFQSFNRAKEWIVLPSAIYFFSKLVPTSPDESTNLGKSILAKPSAFSSTALIWLA